MYPFWAMWKNVLKYLEWRQNSVQLHEEPNTGSVTNHMEKVMEK
jgi:hypothetical protein